MINENILSPSNLLSARKSYSLRKIIGEENLNNNIMPQRSDKKSTRKKKRRSRKKKKSTAKKRVKRTLEVIEIPVPNVDKEKIALYGTNTETKATPLKRSKITHDIQSELKELSLKIEESCKKIEPKKLDLEEPIVTMKMDVESQDEDVTNIKNLTKEENKVDIKPLLNQLRPKGIPEIELLKRFIFCCIMYLVGKQMAKASKPYVFAILAAILRKFRIASF
jgi:hypothetical protein